MIISELRNNRQYLSALQKIDRVRDLYRLKQNNISQRTKELDYKLTRTRLHNSRLLQEISKLQERIAKEKTKIKDLNDSYSNPLFLNTVRERLYKEYQNIEIDVDNMTYEELLELQEKIGNVSKGLAKSALERLKPVRCQQKVNDPCLICFSGIQLQEVILELQECRHKFHWSCIEEWLKLQKKCPTCKQELGMTENLSG